jgi:hypothetical protein
MCAGTKFKQGMFVRTGQLPILESSPNERVAPFHPFLVISRAQCLFGRMNYFQTPKIELWTRNVGDAVGFVSEDMACLAIEHFEALHVTCPLKC